MDYGVDICEADPCVRQVGVIPTMVDPGYAMPRDDEPRPDSSGMSRRFGYSRMRQ